MQIANRDRRDRLDEHLPTLWRAIGWYRDEYGIDALLLSEVEESPLARLHVALMSERDRVMYELAAYLDKFRGEDGHRQCALDGESRREATLRILATRGASTRAVAAFAHDSANVAARDLDYQRGTRATAELVRTRIAKLRAEIEAEIARLEREVIESSHSPFAHYARASREPRIAALRARLAVLPTSRRSRRA